MNTARNEEISRPQPSSVFSSLHQREVEVKNLAAFKASSTELLKTCLPLPCFPTGRPLPVLCPCNWWWENRCLCWFYSNKYVNRQRPVPPSITSPVHIRLLLWIHSHSVFLQAICERIFPMISIWIQHFCFCQKHTFGTQINLPSLIAGVGIFPFSVVCLCKVFLHSPSFIWKTQCIAHMNWRNTNCLGIIWLLRRSFSSSHFFKSRSEKFDCFLNRGLLTHWI